MKPERILLPLALTLTLAFGGAASLATVSTLDDNEPSIVQLTASHGSLGAHAFDAALIERIVLNTVLVVFGAALFASYQDYRAAASTFIQTRAPPFLF